MSVIRLYIDEDAMDRRFLEALRGRGVDLTTVLETETTGFMDQDQLVLSTSLSRVFYTFNVGDFCQLHGQFWRKVETMQELLFRFRTIRSVSKCGGC